MHDAASSAAALRVVSRRSKVEGQGYHGFPNLTALDSGITQPFIFWRHSSKKGTP